MFEDKLGTVDSHFYTHTTYYLNTTSSSFSIHPPLYTSHLCLVPVDPNLHRCGMSDTEPSPQEEELQALRAIYGVGPSSLSVCLWR
jgi:hypothetical protein